MPAADTAAVLELRDVSKSFGPVVALRAGSLRVDCLGKAQICERVCRNYA